MKGAGTRPGGEASDEVDAEALAGSLRALAHATRVRMVGVLARPASVEQLAEAVGLGRQASEHHLRQLERAGLVARTPGWGRPGAVNTYRVVPQRLFSVGEALRKVGDVVPEAGGDGATRLPTRPMATMGGAPVDPDAPRLTIVHGMRPGTHFALPGPGPWLIGRRTDATVCLDYDLAVSSRHAEVRRAAGGGFEVADLYSSNGTTVGWQRLPRGGGRALADPEVLGVGRSLLVFRAPPPPPPAP